MLFQAELCSVVDLANREALYTLQSEHLVGGFVLRNCLLSWNYSNGYTHTNTMHQIRDL